MIYLISDIHGDLNFRGLSEYLEKATDDDLLIILGDTGLEFEKTTENKVFTEKFLSADKNIAIIDGNHDNFSYLNSFPEEEMYGGKIRRLSDKIILLKRGNIYKIGGKSFFVFGGCKSSPKWKERGLWHEGEEPSEQELSLAYDNLEKCGFAVDVILTHKYEETPAKGTVCESLQKLNRFIDQKVEFEKWYSGHWHREGQADPKHIFVYDRLVPLK